LPTLAGVLFPTIKSSVWRSKGIKVRYHTVKRFWESSQSGIP
jgi:hypothetical protein